MTLGTQDLIDAGWRRGLDRVRNIPHLMKLHTAACLLALSSSLAALPVFIGTNTGKNSTSKGIYFADFDPESGKLTEPKLAAEYANPGFLALHPVKPVLLCIGAPKQPFADGTSSVAAFEIGRDYGLKFLGEASTGGKGACHLAVDATGNTVAVASYGDGTISTLRLDENGVPLKTVSVISNTGSGPNKDRQQGPHAHGVYFESSNKGVFVPDLGLDKVMLYSFNPDTSELGVPFSPMTTAPGAGPRHLAFSKGNIYVINELDCTVLAIRFNPDATTLPAVPTLPEGYSGKNTAAEIEASADGRFVYASNRGHDSIAVFSRNAESGSLTPIQHAPCGGRIPRHFKIAPGGIWLLCGHQDSSTISVLPRDPESGKLGAPVCTVPSPSPICILFAR